MRDNQHRIDPALKKAQQQRIFGLIGRLFVGLAVIAVMAGGSWWLNQTMTLNAWTITAPSAIKLAIEDRLQAMQERDFLHTRPASLRQQWLTQIPDMEDVQIERQLPHAMRISAMARTPAALWQDEQNRLHLFDNRGHVYRLLGRGESPDLPLLRVHEEQLPAIHKLLQILSGQQVHGLDALSEIHALDHAWKLYFSRGAVWVLAQKNEQQTIGSIASLLTQPRWRQGQWTVDTRMQSRWFIRPAGRGGVI
ncbi:MAG: cell division protein FtsQ/DivIB [Mariprofundus sp.]